MQRDIADQFFRLTDLIAVGDIGGARERMAELEALDIGNDQSSEIRDRRNRVLRAMIEVSLSDRDRSTGFRRSR